MGKAWSDYMAKNAKREYEESDPMKIIDQLRAELAALKEEQVATLTELQSFREHATALDAHIERLDKALKPFASFGDYMAKHPRHGLAEELYGWDGRDGVVITKSALKRAHQTLASTPSQSLAAHDANVKVAVLREVADKLFKEAEVTECGTFYDAARMILSEADRINKGER